MAVFSKMGYQDGGVPTLVLVFLPKVGFGSTKLGNLCSYARLHSPDAALDLYQKRVQSAL